MTLQNHRCYGEAGNFRLTLRYCRCASCRSEDLLFPYGTCVDPCPVRKLKVAVIQHTHRDVHNQEEIFLRQIDCTLCPGHCREDVRLEIYTDYRMKDSMFAFQGEGSAIVG
jgi:ferredoxin